MGWAAGSADAAMQLRECTKSALDGGVIVRLGSAEVELSSAVCAPERPACRRLMVRDVPRFVDCLGSVPFLVSNTAAAVLDASESALAAGHVVWRDWAAPDLPDASRRDLSFDRQVDALLSAWRAMPVLTPGWTDVDCSAYVIQCAARVRIARCRTAPVAAAHDRITRAAAYLPTAAVIRWECAWQSLRMRGGGGRPLGLRTQRSPPPVSAQAAYGVAPAMSFSGWVGARSTWRVRRRDEAPAVVDASRVFDGGGAASLAAWDGGEPAWLRAAGDVVWSPEWQRTSPPAPRRRTRRQLLTSLEEAASADAERAVETEAATVQSCRVRPSGRPLRRQRFAAAVRIQRAWRRRLAAVWRRGALQRLVGRLAVADAGTAAGCATHRARAEARGPLAEALEACGRDYVTTTTTLTRELSAMEAHVEAADAAVAFERRRYEARERLLRREAEERKGREGRTEERVRDAEACAKAAAARAEAAEAALSDAVRRREAAEAEAASNAKALADAKLGAGTQVEAVEASARERLNVAAAKLKAEAAARADAESRATAAECELAAALCAEPETPSAPVPIARRSGGRQRLLARVRKQQAARDVLDELGLQGRATDGPGGHWAAVAEAQRDMARRLGGDPLEAAQRVERNLAAVRRRLAAQAP